MRAKDIFFGVIIAIIVLLLIAYLYAYYAKWSLENPTSDYAMPVYGTDFYKYISFWVKYYTTLINVSV